jgi:hypothetical protein
MIEERSDPATTSTLTWPVFAVALLMVFIALCGRGATILVNPQPIWDDKNFIADGVFNPGLRSWFAPYAGYILLLPRMLSDWFTVFNLLSAPLYGALFSIATMAWAFCLVLSSGFEHLLPLRSRAVLVALITLMPWHTEVFAAICNIHWLLFVGLALLSLARYERMSGVTRWVLPGATAVLIFSTANSVLTFPIFVSRAISAWRRERYTFWYSLAASGFIVAYAVLTLTVTAAMASSWPGRIELSALPNPDMFVHYLIKGLGYKVVEVSTVGGRVAARFLAMPAVYVVACAVWISLVTIAFALARRRHEGEAALSLVAITYYTLATIVFAGVFRSEYVITHFIRDGQYYGADRYFVAPTLFFYLQTLWVIHRLDAVRRWRVATLTLACAMAAAIAIHFVYPPQPDYRWRDNVLNYYEALLAARGNTTAQFRIVVHPPAPEWNLVLPVYELSPEDRRVVKQLLEQHGRM